MQRRQQHPHSAGPGYSLRAGSTQENEYLRQLRAPRLPLGDGDQLPAAAHRRGAGGRRPALQRPHRERRRGRGPRPGPRGGPGSEHARRPHRRAEAVSAACAPLAVRLMKRSLPRPRLGPAQRRPRRGLRPGGDPRDGRRPRGHPRAPREARAGVPRRLRKESSWTLATLFVKMNGVDLLSGTRCRTAAPRNTWPCSGPSNPWRRRRSAASTIPSRSASCGLRCGPCCAPRAGRRRGAPRSASSIAGWPGPAAPGSRGRARSTMRCRPSSAPAAGRS